MEHPKNLKYLALKKKHRKIRDGQEKDYRVRIHRALSWLSAAENAEEAGDIDAQFIYLWIAFNAAYAGRVGERHMAEASMRKYFNTLLIVDMPENRIISAIENDLKASINRMMKNQFMYAKYWTEYKKDEDERNWEDDFAKDNKKIKMHIEAGKNTVSLLARVFLRLYTLRNQILHGGATYNSRVNRQSIKQALPIIAFLVPLFIDIMMKNRNLHLDWGELEYPNTGSDS